MNAFEAYELYIAVKQHFTKPSYDFHKYNGKTTASVSKFESRPDKSFFYKIAKQYPKAKLIDFYVANFVDSPELWIGDLLDETAEAVYTEWQKKIESLSYHFTEQCDGLLSWTESKRMKFDELFQIHDSDHPVIVKMVLQRILTLETFIILEQLLKFGKIFNQKLDDIIFRDLWFKVLKYRSFLEIDLVKSKKILREKIEEHPSLI